MKPTNVNDFIGELSAGVVEEKLATMLSTVASQVVQHKKGGEVTLTLKMKPVGDHDQVNIEHKLAYKQPKKRGTIAEDDTQETVMYVNEGGNLSQFPEHQMDMIGKGDTQHVD